MPLNTTPFDAAEILKTPEDIAYFLEAAFDDADATHIAHALGIVGRSPGMMVLAEQTGRSPQAIHELLSCDGSLLETLLKVMSVLRLRLVAGAGS